LLMKEHFQIAHWKQWKMPSSELMDDHHLKAIHRLRLSCHIPTLLPIGSRLSHNASIQFIAMLSC
mgnify:CR=1